MRYYQENPDDMPNYQMTPLPPTPRTILNTSIDDMQRRASQKIRKDECYERLEEFDVITNEFERMSQDFNMRFIDPTGNIPDPFVAMKDIRRAVLQKLCESIVIPE